MNFGRVELKGQDWYIWTEPHIRARLKRVFPRAPQQASDHQRLSATPENSRELKWFLERYPMQVNAPEQLDALACAHVEMEQRLAELLGGKRTPREIALAEPARDYQLLAADSCQIRGGLLLADDVGLGKTVSGLLLATKADYQPTVVVCPAHMPSQWAEAFARFAPGLRVHRIRKGTPYPLTRGPRQRLPDLWPDSPPDVLISSYHKLRGWAETLGEFCRYAIFDECQQLRSPNSDIYRAAAYVARRATLRMGLSATPIYNYGAEFFWVVDALIPGALGNYDEFIREWCIAGMYGEKARLADSEQFGAYLRREGIMLRRTRADVKRELPDLQKIEHTVESDAKVLEQLSGNAVELARVILAHNERFRGEKMKAAGEFDNLVRQATGVAKAPYVAEFVRLLVENDQPVVLFGWHREVYGIWLEALADLNPVMYTGSESGTRKDEAKRAFLAGESKLLIMSLRSGAGVDGLQEVCSTVVFGELDWSPGVHEQCIGRVHRDGQPDPVLAYYLVSEDGSDPIIADVLGVKREQIEGVRNPAQGLIERIHTGENELRRLAQAFLASRGEAKPLQPAATPLFPALEES